MKRAWLQAVLSLRDRLQGRHDIKAIAGNTGWQVADQLVRMSVGLLLSIWLARYLGPEQFGMLSYALAFVALFTALASLGLDDIIVREIVSNPGDKEVVLGSAFCLKLAGGVVCLASAAVLIFVLQTDGLSRWLVIIIASGAVFQAGSVIEFWFHSQVQAKYVVLAKNCAFLCCSLVKAILIVGKASLLAFAWIALVEVILGSLGLVLAYQLKGQSLARWRVRARRVAALLKDSWALMLSGVMIAVYLRIDQVMLGQLSGNEEVGIYSVAVRLAEAWLFIPAAVYWSLFPGIVEAKKQSEKLFHERLQGFYNLMALSAYAIAVPTMFLAQWLVPMLFGDAYAGGGILLAVLIWANVFASLEVARSAFLTAMNWTRLYLLTVSMGCVLNVMLNYWLIPLYGAMGAVLASLVSYWFAAHGSCFMLKPLRQTGGMMTRAMLCPKVW